MTTYKTTAYETTEALHNAIRTDLDQLAYPYAVKHKFYGEGQLISVKVPSNKACRSLYIDVAFGHIHNIKTIDLDVAFSARVLTFPEILTDILVEAQTAFRADFEARERAQREANRLAREEAETAAKKEAEEKKAAEKYEKTKAKAIRDFETLAADATPKSITDEFYYSLGWLANNTGTLSAAMPDYLLSYFEKHFGTEAKPIVVDSKKRTVGGYAMQWALSMKAPIKKKSVATIPACLTKHLGKTGTAITDTSFVWDLVENYGFQFGTKKQDIDKIRACVPSDYIKFFEAGLA